ncbi:MAG: alpha/beta hydrolase family protein [Planctomycetota bacterium]
MMQRIAWSFGRRHQHFRRLATNRLLVFLLSILTSVAGTPLIAQQSATDKAAAEKAGSQGDQFLQSYFQAETARLRERCLAEVQTVTDWTTRRDEYRRQLFYMLGLDPLPERTALQATVTSRQEADGIVVEQVHFQSRPGLYVTGNLYRPQESAGRAPAILYVCGHGGVKLNGISYGNKVHYQHHGAWFARHGYVCLIIDSLQLGEIEATHHGTHNLNQWWWLSRGYTPAGVEAWNCIRALDYLQSREDVDPEKLGVTGRSGGGAYSWWIAALDERIRAAVPVAGITDLEDHVVAGCVAGHCDCMYQVNTYRWDYPQVAALVSPRPLLISNTDRDPIFPLAGVMRTYVGARRMYELQKVPEKIALNITAGGHVDTQELQIHAMRWFDAQLRGGVRLIDEAARPRFTPQQLKVFTAELPADQINTKIQESFVPVAQATLPADEAAWNQQRDTWLKSLQEQTFRGWPVEKDALQLQECYREERDGVVLKAYDFTSQKPFRLRLYVIHAAGLQQPDLTVLNTLDDRGWKDFLKTHGAAFADRLQADLKQTGLSGERAQLPPPSAESWQQTRAMLTKFPWVMAYLAPRGEGLSQWNSDPKTSIQIRRRFYLLGQSLEGMQAWDVRRGMEAVRAVPIGEKQLLGESPLWLQAHGSMAALTLYASLFEPPVKRLDLHELPRSHDAGPALLNVRRILDLPQAVALAVDRSQVFLYQQEEAGWDYPRQLIGRLGREHRQFTIRPPVEEKR